MLQPAHAQALQAGVGSASLGAEQLRARALRWPRCAGALLSFAISLVPRREKRFHQSEPHPANIFVKRSTSKWQITELLDESWKRIFLKVYKSRISRHHVGVRISQHHVGVI